MMIFANTNETLKLVSPREMRRRCSGLSTNSSTDTISEVWSLAGNAPQSDPVA